jgi:BirA family transcriptional regulator, biotin operon repressor / biotin---[acetyl-CoA-carboxylase] ligase
MVDERASMSEVEEPLVARLFAKLADGRFHSGEDLAAELAVSRSAVWKAARALRELGATVHAVRNRGYRLPAVAEPLDGGKIQALLGEGVRERIRRLDTVWTVGSTNTLLLERGNPPVGSSEALLAEYQTAGRGRRGRNWVAPPGGSICLSLSWMFREVPRDLGALGLVVGVCALRALSRVGVGQARLKWPNDLLVDDRKLGGILIELRAESAGPACVIIGIGLNVALGAPLLEKIAAMGLAPIDLAAAGLKEPSRNAVAAGLISSFVRGLLEFERDGLKPFVREWMEADALRGRPVTVTAGEAFTKGVARGIDLDGALLVETPRGLLRFISGDVSVRAES